MRRLDALQEKSARRRWALVACVSVMAVAASLPACAASQTSTARSRTLVTYREDGGIGGPRGSLIVSAHRRATVTVAGGRASAAGHWARFRLNASLWRRLRATLKRADMHSLAGDHFPPSWPYPDAITYVVTAGSDTVRTADGAVPRRLKPLLSVLRRIVAIGERRLQSTHNAAS